MFNCVLFYFLGFDSYSRKISYINYKDFPDLFRKFTIIRQTAADIAYEFRIGRDESIDIEQCTVHSMQHTCTDREIR